MTEDTCMTHDLRVRRILNAQLSYDEFRSELCHMYKTDGNVVFLTKILKSDMVNKLWEKKKYAYALYILSMVDYISWKNKVPFYNGFNELRSYKLKNTLYPAEVIILDKIDNSNRNKRNAYEECKNSECGKFFIEHNIVEKSIENE